MKKLYKSRNNKLLFGVCGGLGEYLEVDPSVLRIVWLVFAFTGIGALAYFASGLILPFKEDI